MNQSPQIIYPNIDLFLYDLREGLGQAPTAIEEARKQFWKRVYPDLDDTEFNQKLQPLSRKEQSESEIIELLKPTEHESFSPTIEGYCEAWQLGDTYALHVDCSPKDITIPSSVEIYRDLKAAIESRMGGLQSKIHLETQQGSVGQSCLMWGKMTECNPDPPRIQEIAQACYQQFAPDANSTNLVRDAGQLGGGFLFEAWSPPKNWANPEDFKRTHHVLIFLFPEEMSIQSIDSKIAGLYFPLIRLLLYRSKILWSYHQSRQPESKLKSDYVEIEDLIQKVSHLSQPVSKNQKEAEKIYPGEGELKALQRNLRKTLNVLSKYAPSLNDLEIQIRTIKVNLDNYKSRVGFIQSLDEECDLQYFREFADFTRYKYLNQAENDLDNLRPGLTLLENLIRAIEGTIDIYQTASDRQLNYTIGIASFGVATSAVVATVRVSQPPGDVERNEFHVATVFESLFWGCIVSLAVWGILQLWRKS